MEIAAILARLAGRFARRLPVRPSLFWPALREAEGLLPHLPEALLSDLVVGWGNEGWSAREELLQKIAEEACMADGPILECGGGLSTLILGMAAARRNNRVWTLEHKLGWATVVRAALDEARISSVRVCWRPLRSYGSYSWYKRPPAGFGGPFSLVICDGPPEGTPGCRYGLMAVMRPFLKSTAVVLVDDVASGGRNDLERWARDFGVAYEILGERKPFGRAVWTGEPRPKTDARPG